MVGTQDVYGLLKRAKITKRDTVLIHTSMRAIGQVDGGCDGLIDSFVSYLQDGLFLVPTHTWAMLEKENPTFEVRNSLTCIGALPNVATRRTDGVRSMHPTHSLVAFGKRAKEYVQGEENARTPCPVGGAWARLYEENATVLLLGVGLERNTYIHAVDEMLDLPNRLAEPKTVCTIDYEGRETRFAYQGHSGAISEFFPNFKRAFETLGALSYDTLGNATVGIFNVRKGTQILKRIFAHATFDPCDGVQEIPKEWYL